MEFAKSRYATWYQRPEWKSLREKHLANNWKCVQCDATNDLHVDHIIDFDGNEALFSEMQNLQTLCHRCHFNKTNIDKLIYSKPDGDWEITMVEIDEPFPYEKEKAQFGANNVCDRYATKCVADSLVKKTVEINTKFWNVQELRLIIIKIIIGKKTCPIKINGMDWGNYWSEYFKGNKSTLPPEKKETTPETKPADSIDDILKLWGV